MERASSDRVDWAGSRDLHVELAPRGDRRDGAGARRAGGDPRRPARRGRPPALHARAGRGPRARARDGRGGLRAADRRGLPDGASRARRRAWPSAVAVDGPPGRSRRASCRAWTSSRARPTSARSRAGRGCVRCGAASRPRPTACSATATCAGVRSCARRSPPTSAARAAWSPTPTGSSSARASTRASRCCWRRCRVARWRWRTRAWTSTARSCARPAARSCR